MHHSKLLIITLLAGSPLALAPLAGCGGDDDGKGGAASSSTSGTGGTGSGTGGQGGEGGSGGAGGGEPGVVADHLLISEIAVRPGSGEFIEIWNPTSAEVDLTNYYISDNSAYVNIADGQAWAPLGTPGLDFLVKFPDGTTIPAGGYLTLATDPGFEIEYETCANYALTATAIPCGGDSIPAMVAPENGALGEEDGGLLTDDGEMVMLFQWDGTVGHALKDVDYVIWGEETGASERADKTGLTGYKDDTARGDQRAAVSPAQDETLQRCLDGREPGEDLTEGNGITGHDETSEWLDQSLTATTTRTPGAKNNCAP